MVGRLVRRGEGGLTRPPVTRARLTPAWRDGPGPGDVRRESITAGGHPPQGAGPDSIPRPRVTASGGASAAPRGAGECRRPDRGSARRRGRGAHSRAEERLDRPRRRRGAGAARPQGTTAEDVGAGVGGGVGHRTRVAGDTQRDHALARRPPPPPSTIPSPVVTPVLVSDLVLARTRTRAADVVGVAPGAERGPIDRRAAPPAPRPSRGARYPA